MARFVRTLCLKLLFCFTSSRTAESAEGCQGYMTAADETLHCMEFGLVKSGLLRLEQIRPTCGFGLRQGAGYRNRDWNRYHFTSGL